MLILVLWKAEILKNHSHYFLNLTMNITTSPHPKIFDFMEIRGARFLHIDLLNMSKIIKRWLITECMLLLWRLKSNTITVHWQLRKKLLISVIGLTTYNKNNEILSPSRLFAFFSQAVIIITRLLIFFYGMGYKMKSLFESPIDLALSTWFRSRWSKKRPLGR